MALTISNQQTRRLLIHANGLGTPPTGPLNLSEIIRDLGYVQIDTIRNVTRAHHHILWSRNQNYREPMLWEVLKSRQLFEHFTHDASLIHMDIYPLWSWQFGRMKERFEKSKRWTPDPELCKHIKLRITDEGPLSTHAFDTKIQEKKEMWARPPHKRMLDYLWYIGELTTSHRENFVKYYDLTERVISHPVNHKDILLTQQFHILNKGALKRLIIATPSELQDFWGAASAAQVKTWISENSNEYVPVNIQSQDGTLIDALALPNIEIHLAALKTPTQRLRILSPFDPLIRNRKRLKRIFGFDYKIEIFVPAAKRKWGYYVYPLLEGDQLIGRIELSCDRKAGTLSIANLWPEPHIKWTPRKQSKLHAELKRFAKLADVTFHSRHI